MPKFTLAAAVLAFAALSAGTSAAAQTAAPIPCERACMEDMADKVLSALAARDASRLPVFGIAGVRCQGQAMGFDNGLWQTASKVGAYRHVIADPATGQFGFFSTMDENGRGLTAGVRVKLHLGHISEMELVTYRTGSGPAWNDAGYANLEKMKQPSAVWREVRGRKLSRQELVATANKYFTAIERNDGKGEYPFTEDCDRLENGTLTTNTPGMIRMGDVDIGGMGCNEQFSTGLYGVVTEVHSRRFPIVDEERQSVFAFAVFDHCGCKRELAMPDGKVVPIAAFNRPSSILLAEAFKMDGPLIRQVEAVGTSVPYHMKPGW